MVAFVVVEFTPVKSCSVVDEVTSRFVVVAIESVVFPVTVKVPATATLPAESMVVVAVAPKYARYADKIELEALVNCWSPVQLFAFVRLTPRFPLPSVSVVSTEVVAIAPVPFPVTRVFAIMLPHPVPPFATCKIPVTSLARLTSPVEIAPAVALKIPESAPIEREPKKPEVDDAYVAEIFVVDAFPNVCVAVKVFVV